MAQMRGNKLSNAKLKFYRRKNKKKTDFSHCLWNPFLQGSVILSLIQIMCFFPVSLPFSKMTRLFKESYQQNFSVIVETSWAQSLRLLGIWENDNSTI